MFAAAAEAVVNPVNVREAVMGAGVAKVVATRWPEVVSPYRAACRDGSLRIGTVLVTPVEATPPLRAVIHVPTKDSWRQPSELRFIEAAMEPLADALVQHGIRSVAMPALGCGLGGLPWTDVRAVLQRLAALVPDCEIHLFRPMMPRIKMHR
jgi:O-acetyl-ADP-ribose deacetylase (regulator of RNase III)